MPELERWEQKAIGRINRFENTDYEYVTNQIYEGGRSLLNRIAQGAMNMGRGVVGILSRPLNTQTINGKGFTENYGVSSRFGRRVGLGAANMAIDAGANTVNNFLTRKFFYPSGKAVADTAFAGRVTFDKEMARQMFNDCGYAPDLQATMKRMYDTAAVVEKGLTDITWRKDITPHMIRSAYQQELENTFEAIRNQHRENPAFTSRGMMKHQMQAAARHLGNIFEKFTLDLANQTDYLEAPMTILPKKAEIRSDVQMRDDEKKLLAEVSRQSLFPDAKAMEKQIDQAMKKLPKPTVEAALEKFRSNLEKPVRGKDGREADYTPGANTAEDIRRLDSSILSLREMKQRYENRNFFSRLLSSAARAERNAIATMEAQLQEKLGVRAEALTVLLDLKNPLEEMADPTHFLGIRKRGPEKEPEPPTVTQTVKNAAKKTGEAISAAAKTTYQTGEHIVTGAVSGVTNAVNTVLDTAANVDGGLIDQKDANIFEDLTEKDYEDDLFDRDFTEKHSEPEPKAPEQPKPQEEPQESYLGNLLTGAGMILGALNPLNLFRGSEPEPETIALFSDDGPVFPEEPPKPEAPKPEQKSPHQELLQARQAEVYNDLKTSKNVAGDFFPAISKLLYFKTLEISLNSKAMNPGQLEASLSEQSIKDNCAHIRSLPAFQRLDLLNRGLAAKAKAFIEKAPTDPSVLNKLHKEYMIRLNNPDLNKAKESVPEAELNKDISKEAISKAMHELRM